MKKLLIVFVVLLSIAISLVYIFIPNTIIINRQVKIYTPEEAVFKYVVHPREWEKWWPGATKNFTVKRSMMSAVEGTLTFRADTLPGIVSYDVVKKNNIILNFNVKLSAGNSPLSRLSQYVKAVKLSGHIDTLLNNARVFLEDDMHVYGIRVRREKVLFPFLLTSKTTAPLPLTTVAVANELKKLRAYAATHSSQEIGKPMLNVTMVEDAKYVTMVAIPLDNKINGSQNIYLKQMPYKGNMLTTTIMGGPKMISNATEQLINYMKDNNYTSPGAPFEEMLVDRAAVTDTSKWNTRICYPVL